MGVRKTPMISAILGSLGPQCPKVFRLQGAEEGDEKWRGRGEGPRGPGPQGPRAPGPQLGMAELGRTATILGLCWVYSRYITIYYDILK